MVVEWKGGCVICEFLKDKPTELTTHMQRTHIDDGPKKPDPGPITEPIDIHPEDIGIEDEDDDDYIPERVPVR